MTEPAVDQNIQTPAAPQEPVAPQTPAAPAAGDDQTHDDRVQALARAMGWRPDFQGDGAVDAETYILKSQDIKKSMSNTIRTLRRELEATQAGVETIKWSMEQSTRREVQQLKAQIADLKAQRKQAVTDGNADAVEAFDGRIQALEDAAKDTPPPPPSRTPNTNPDYLDWVEGNRWYETNPELREYANNLGELPEMKALPYTRMLTQIAKKVQDAYPEHFAKPKAAAEPANPDANSQPSSAAVAPVSPSRQRAKPSATRKATAADLSHEERTAGNRFVRMGIFKNLDDYAAKLQERESAMQAAGRR